MLPSNSASQYVVVAELQNHSENYLKKLLSPWKLRKVDNGRTYKRGNGILEFSGDGSGRLTFACFLQVQSKTSNQISIAEETLRANT